EAAAILALAEDITHALKPSARRLGAPGLVQAYTGGADSARGETPWCLIDRHHRTLLRLHHGHLWQDDAPAETEAAFNQLVALTRHRHAEAVSDLAEAFVAALAGSQYSVPGVLAQADLFAQQLGAHPPGRTAYVLVDALRFEMAHELAAGEIAGWQSALTPAIATFPSITPIGMAALMPGAERGITLAARGKQLVVEIGGHDVTGRAKRITQLRRSWPDVVECKLGDLRPAKPALRKQLEAAPQVLITSQEIDEVAETSGGAFARTHMTGVLDDLRGAFRTLSAAGIERIIVTADHGHLFGDEISAGEKIDAPGGETIELHRRVWIGRGGDAAPGYVRMQASELGLSGDLEFATPRSTAVFTAAGGSNDYFHGGLSLQELVIPVLELTRAAGAGGGGVAPFSWELTPGSKAITSRFCTVRIGGGTGQQQLALLTAPPQPPVARVELRAGAALVGKAIAASYGFREAGGEVELRLDPADPTRIEPNTVTFQMAEGVTSGAATAVLIDAVTGRELARFADIPVSIAF
ncbi:MAG: PglZ domain-containing protein, partial [Thermomicrobiales bacterium]